MDEVDPACFKIYNIKLDSLLVKSKIGLNLRTLRSLISPEVSCLYQKQLHHLFTWTNQAAFFNTGC